MKLSMEGTPGDAWSTPDIGRHVGVRTNCPPKVKPAASSARVHYSSSGRLPRSKGFRLMYLAAEGPRSLRLRLRHGQTKSIALLDHRRDHLALQDWLQIAKQSQGVVCVQHTPQGGFSLAITCRCPSTHTVVVALPTDTTSGSPMEILSAVLNYSGEDYTLNMSGARTHRCRSHSSS